MRTLDVLESVVANIRCKPGWQFRLVPQPHGDHNPVELVISIPVEDSRPGYSNFGTGEGGGNVRIGNHFPVPEATYNYASWRRWVFDCCVKVETHEVGEWFIDSRAGEGPEERPFAPLHGPGEDPYTVHEFRDVVDARTQQDGTVK